jgi:hypothetical protein
MGERYKQAHEDEQIFPVMKGYKMACCDCGLVHIVNFVIGRQTKKGDNGYYDFEEITDPDLQVMMTVRRNNRSTAQKRRHSR